jgi:L-alanine-DL-glutamate epimerase-like enolase superfamily enzyme
VTAGGVATMREGVLVSLHGDDGLVGVGEASLLPELESAVDAMLAAVETAAVRIAGLTVEDAASAIGGLADPGDLGAAVRCAFDVAALDLLGQAAGRGVAALLVPTPRGEVAVNAVVSVASQEAAAAAARRAVEAGFGTVKL